MNVSSRSVQRAALAAVVLGALLGLAVALARAAETPCPDGREPVGSFGIGRVQMKGEITRSDDEPPVVRFRSEPVILSIDPRGPARGALRAGDAVVAIDGRLITTAAGGRLYSNPPIGRPVELTVRRGGRTTVVSVVPVPRCREEAEHALPETPDLPAPPAPPAPRGHVGRVGRTPPAPPGAPAPGAPPTPAAPVARAAPEAVATPSAAPGSPAPMAYAGRSLLRRLSRLDALTNGDAWAGIGLRYDQLDIRKGSDGRQEVTFGAPPVIISVDDDSPAARAGLQPGDVLQEIDGRPATSADAIRRLFGVPRGGVVPLTVAREGRTRQVTLERRSAAAGGARAARAARLTARDRVRYKGSLGGARIEVLSPEQTTVSVEERPGEVIIDTGNALIRLWIGNGGEGGNREGAQ